MVADQSSAARRMAKTPKTKVPFNQHGHMLMSKRDYHTGDIVWRDSKPFFGELLFDRMSFGASARRVIMLDEGTGLRYSMQLDEWVGYVPLLEEGRLCGRFGFKKKGQFWSLVLLSRSPLEMIAAQAD